MDISRALPVQKYAQAAAHSRSSEFRAKRDEAIANIRNWSKHPDVNKQFPPAVWFGYGKDAMAVSILLEAANIDFTALVILNGGDLPQHELVFPEFDRFLDFRKIVFETELRYIEYLYDAKDWGLLNGMTTKSGQPINYWDLGEMADMVYWDVDLRFWGEYEQFQPDVLYFSGRRAAESMERYYEVKNKGPMHRVGDKALEVWIAYPLYNWRDIDVWALLVSLNCPVSPVYSMHDIPQKGGKQAFPRTYWYPEPVLMNGQYFKWLARYAPAQLRELTECFPEIEVKLRSGS